MVKVIIDRDCVYTVMFVWSVFMSSSTLESKNLSSSVSIMLSSHTCGYGSNIDSSEKRMIFMEELN